MKWVKVRAGLYRSGKYELRQAWWRAQPDGWLVLTDDDSFHDSARLLVNAKRKAEGHVERQTGGMCSDPTDPPVGGP